MYLYETHCHTAKASACSRLSPEETVELYLCNGYSGIFVTDHFLNGNTTVDKRLPFAKAVERFCEGFEEVKRAAGERLQVFFGFEYSYLGTDVLCYGWDKKTLLGFPQILSMSMREFCDFCRENGALAVQAEPAEGEAHGLSEFADLHELEFKGVEDANTHKQRNKTRDAPEIRVNSLNDGCKLIHEHSPFFSGCPLAFLMKDRTQDERKKSSRHMNGAGRMLVRSCGIGRTRCVSRRRK